MSQPQSNKCVFSSFRSDQFIVFCHLQCSQFKTHALTTVNDLLLSLVMELCKKS